LMDDVEADKPGTAIRRKDCRREHADGGRLAGTVGAEQPEHLSGLDGEVDSLDGLDTTRVGLREPVDRDRDRPCAAIAVHAGSGTASDGCSGGSIARRGSLRSAQLGNHQVARPNSCRTAGSRIMRMTIASRKTATASVSPNSLRMWLSLAAKEAKTTIITAAA